jgi:hypothetical protein
MTGRRAVTSGCATLVVVLIGRVVVNLGWILGQLTGPDPVWLRAVTMLAAIGGPVGGNAIVQVTLFGVLPVAAFTWLKIANHDWRFRVGLPAAVALLVVDVAVQVLSPSVGIGLRWTTSWAGQFPAILQDAIAAVVFDGILLVAGVGLLSSLFARLWLTRRSQKRSV